ncbi:hypothetical protein H5410_002303 [Solanum commersonii]|uniref:Uncharacterized protein n=1 Tax=Solanum commersonii TaxID=4109 RepID=A0A9J6B1Z0_SOLCO|nr:hypothetical protein H5410_002303 [Solanum commersonii]
MNHLSIYAKTQPTVNRHQEKIIQIRKTRKRPPLSTKATTRSGHQEKHTYKRSLRNKTRRRRKWEDEQENKENIKKLEGEYKNYTLAEWRKWIDALKLEKLASKMKK